MIKGRRLLKDMDEANLVSSFIPMEGPTEFYVDTFSADPLRGLNKGEVAVVFSDSLLKLMSFSSEVIRKANAKRNKPVAFFTDGIPAEEFLDKNVYTDCRTYESSPDMVNRAMLLNDEKDMELIVINATRFMEGSDKSFHRSGEYYFYKSVAELLNTKIIVLENDNINNIKLLKSTFKRTAKVMSLDKNQIMGPAAQTFYFKNFCV